MNNSIPTSSDAPPPPGVPAQAQFQGDTRLWADGDLNSIGEKTGLWRFWNEKGRLTKAIEYIDGMISGSVKKYDEMGEIYLEIHYKNEAKNGPFFSRLQPGHYSDSRIIAERGEFEQDHAVSTWSFMDDRGRVIQSIEFGESEHNQEKLLRSAIFSNKLDLLT